MTLALMPVLERTEACWLLLESVHNPALELPDFRLWFPEEADAELGVLELKAYAEHGFIEEVHQYWKAQGGMGVESIVMRWLVRVLLEQDKAQSAWRRLVEAGMEPELAWEKIQLPVAAERIKLSEQVELPQAAVSELLTIGQQNKLEAIKVLREASGISLKEAKEIINRLLLSGIPAPRLVGGTATLAGQSVPPEALKKEDVLPALEEHSEHDQLLVAALKSRIPPASASTIALKLGISQQTLESWLDTFGVSYLKRLRQPLPDWEQRFGLAEYELFIAEMQTMRQTQQGGSFFYTWAVLVCLGMEPQEAQLLLQQWQDYSQTLPSGQWIPEEWQARHQLGDSSMVRLMHGLTVPKAMAQKLLNTVRAGQKIKAIKDLRVAVYCGLKEAKEAVEDLADRGMTVMSGSFQPRRRKHRSEARKYLDCCISRLLTDFPLHWVILSAATIVEDPTHPTMAVGSSQNGQLFLFYNPDFTLKLLEEQAQGVLLHEVNHVLFQHLSPITGIDGSSMAWKFACECTANEYIPYSLPGNPITLELLGLPPKESTSTRYSKLLRRGLQGSLCAGIIERALKSGATHHQDTEDSPPRHPIAMIREAASLVGEEVPLETRLSLATHYPCDSWVERLEPEGLGSLPWKELLALSARGLRVRYATRRYPSRRQPESLGIVPGKRSRREHPRVLVAIDTSGSMGDYELLQIAEELRGLTEGDVAVTVVHCDSMIHEVTKVGKGFVLRELKGRGGTDLRPPFEEAFLRQHQPDLVVYFTDGYGPAPDAPPSNVEVLWILTGYRPQVPARFGKVVTMLPRDRRSRVKPLPT